MFSMTTQQKILFVLFLIAAYVVYLQVTQVEPFVDTNHLEHPVSVVQVFDAPYKVKHIDSPKPISRPISKPISRPISKPISNEPLFVPIKTDNNVDTVKGEPIRPTFSENYGQQRQRTYQMDTARNMKRFIRP